MKQRNRELIQRRSYRRLYGYELFRYRILFAEWPVNSYLSSQMNILQTCSSRSWGGLEMQTVKISHTLVSRGHRVTLLCRPGAVLEKEARRLDLKVEPLFNDDLRLLRSIYKISKLLRSATYDVIHSQLSHDLWSLVPAMRWTNCNTRLLLTKRMASSVNKKDFFHRILYNRLDKILTISDFIRNNVLDTCPVSEMKVMTLLNGLDIDKYNPNRYDCKEIRKTLGIGLNTLVVGIVGRFTLKKGHREFLCAARQITKETNLKLAFLIVGEASQGESAYEKELRDMVSELKLDTQVIFTGFCKKVQSMLSAMDILVFPSYAESFGNTLLEAMAMQLPVVANNSGAVPEIVVDGETGFLVPPKDTAQLVQKLVSLLNDKPLRRQMGLAGRQRVVNHFNFDQFMENLEHHYHE